jgi:transcriptional antiterminator NusG
MWYVIQVRVGSEENIKLQCHRNIEKHIMERCFVPYYEEKKKIQGKWRIEKKRLFP